MVPAASATMGPNLLCRGVFIAALMPGISLPRFSDYRRAAPRRSPAAETNGAALRSRGKIFWSRPEDPVGASRGMVGLRHSDRAAASSLKVRDQDLLATDARGDAIVVRNRITTPRCAACVGIMAATRADQHNRPDSKPAADATRLTAPRPGARVRPMQEAARAASRRFLSTASRPAMRRA